MNNKFIFDIERSSPLHAQVKQNLVRLIESGALKAGDQIPPEVEIARKYNISRGTVRTAMAELAREGLISRRQKRGSVVLEKISDHAIRIGVWSPVLALEGGNLDYYVAELEKSLRTAALDRKIILLLLPKCDRIDQVVQLMASNGIAGLLAPAPRKKDKQLLDEIQKRKIACLSMAAKLGNGLNFIAVDHEQGAMRAVDCLARLGHKRIGFIDGSPDFYDSASRYAGYRKGLEKNRIAYDAGLAAICEKGDWRTWAEKAVLCMLKAAKPSALITGGEHFSLGAFKAITRLGLTVPADISVIGFDDFFMAAHLVPPLTTISQPVGELGRLGIATLLDLVKGKIKPPVQKILQTKLIVRESVVKLAYSCKE